VFDGVFALAIGAAAATAGPLPAAEGPPATAPTALVAPWRPVPFAELALADPALAMTWARAPRWWGAASAPRSVPDSVAFGEALAATLEGVLALPAEPIRVVVAAVDGKLPEAAAYGEIVLLLVPASTPTSDRDLVRAAGLALLADRTGPAPPDPRCNEPLLVLGEALAAAGGLALAALPAELRPVHDWLEDKDVRAALDNVVAAALDGEVPWQTRRAQLGRLARPGGAPPAIAQAAAFLVEAFGDAERARRQPFDLLLAWREGRRPEWPPAPRELRRALERPMAAGEPEDDERTRGDAEEIARDALTRAFAARAVARDAATAAPPSLRLAAAGNERGAGGEPCAWTDGLQLPEGVRTGCRDTGEAGGFVYARPVSGGGSEIVARSPAGEQVVLVSWPGWVLFPAVTPAGDELLFIDAGGLWRVQLAGGAPPRRLLAGDLRFLEVSPDGEAIATARWPGGEVALVTEAGASVTATRGAGGLAWIESDIALASDGEKLTLLSLDGASRPFPASLACTRSLDPAPGAVLAAVGAPCEAGLVRLGLADAAAARLLGTPEAPLGVVRLPGGAVALGVAGELWVWSGAGNAQRVGAGLTPGPG